MTDSRHAARPDDNDDLFLHNLATRHTDETVRDRAKSALYEKHKKMLSKEAYTAHWRDFSRGGSYDLDDYVQEARLVALEAYSRYDPAYRTTDGVATKLSSFVCHSVRIRLKGIYDDLAPIRCASQNRKWKTYFRGGYDKDPVKKAAFEQKHDLTTPDAVEAMRHRYQGLLAVVESLDAPTDKDDTGYSFVDSVVDPSTITEEQILEHVLLEDELSTWADGYVRVFQMHFVEGKTLNEISEVIGLEARFVKTKARVVHKRLKEFRNRLALAECA